MKLFNYVKKITEGGTKVLPIAYKSKIPLIKGWPATASFNSEQIDEWFKNKEMNAGIPTGIINGFWVLDIDVKNGGFESLKKLIEMFGDLIKLCFYVIDTGGGGVHLYFKLKEGQTIPSTTSVMPGIDVRGEGGQVVSPFSTHESGKIYEVRLEHEDKTLYVDQLSYAPDDLVNFILDGKKSKQISPISPYHHIAGDFTKLTTGQRNDGLFKRLCQLRNVPFSWEGFLAMAQAENLKLCEPPLNEAEVSQIAHSVFSRYKPRKDIPEPVIEDKAFYGILGKMVNLIKDETEASKEALLFQAIVILGNLFDRKFYMTINGSNIYTNEFALMVGKTSKARKGTGFKAISFFFKKGWGKVFEDRIKRGVSTGEGIIWAIHDDIFKEFIDKNGERQKKLEYAGIENKNLIFLEEEFSKPIKNGKRDNNNLSETLRVAFDSDTLQSLSKIQPATASNPNISLIGHTTKEEFTKVLSDVDKDNGMFNRILFAHSYRANILPHPKDFEIMLKESGILIDLFVLKDFIDKSESIKINFTDKGAEWWDKFYTEHGNAPDQANENIKGRTETHILKIAMIFAVSDKTYQLDVDHLEAASAVINYSNQTIDYVFGNQHNQISPLTKITSFIQSKGGQCNRTAISYELFSKKIKSYLLDQYREQLKAKNQIEIIYQDKTEIWSLSGDMPI